MSDDNLVARRSVLLGAAGLAGVAATGAIGTARAADAETVAGGHVAHKGTPLWREAWPSGLVYGCSISTWQLDRQYRRLFRHEAAMLSLQDDLLWYKLKPKPTSPLDFRAGDRMVNLAQRNGMLVLGAPGLVWDAGFGNGWTTQDIWGLKEHAARKLLFGIVERCVRRYRGRMAGWIVCNEVTDPEGTRHGERTNVPWYHTIGPDYVHDAFHIAHREDHRAELLINESGLETVNKYGDKADARQRALLKFLDRLLHQGVPVQGVGIESHLLAPDFKDRFHTRHFLKFLKEIADRGLRIHITELDVQDDGLPPNHRIRDRGVADVYRRYLDTVLQEPAVKTVITFGLSDRYTQLTEDFPRADGLPRRALPFNKKMERKPAYYALSHALSQAPRRHPDWRPPKAR